MPLRIKWDSVLAFSLMHGGAVLACFAFSWKAFWIFLALQWLTGGLGICLGYHRLLTHRSVEIWKPLEYALAFLGCLAWQNGPIRWVAIHRLHHARSDRPNDPHSPSKGFWWAHIGWMCVENDERDRYDRYKAHAPDLARDPIHRFLDATHGVYQPALAVLLYLWGGWPFVLWGFCLRTVFVWHATWAVNSAAHTWGYRAWATDDRSTNNGWVALLTYGEGWHNNHHAFLRSAAHGLRWWELDATYLTIRALRRMGLAWNVQLPTLEQEQRLAAQRGSRRASSRSSSTSRACAPNSLATAMNWAHSSYLSARSASRR